MTCISNFIKGLRMAHVDYATRHYSRSYDAGANSAVIGIMSSPLLVFFFLGFIAGRYI